MSEQRHDAVAVVVDAAAAAAAVVEEEQEQEQEDEARVLPVIVSSPENAIYRERHIDGFKEDLKIVENDVNDIYTAVKDIMEQFVIVYISPTELRNRLIRTIRYSMWCVNGSITRVIRNLKEIENYVAIGLADADDLDEDDPLLRTRKVDHLCVAMRMACVIVTYGNAIVQHSDWHDGTQTLADLSRKYVKLTLIVAHYRRFGGSGYNRGAGDTGSLDEEHRPQLTDALNAVAVADEDCHRMIIDECLTEMAELTSLHVFVYRRNRLLRKWKSRAVSVGRYMMNMMRDL